MAHSRRTQPREAVVFLILAHTFIFSFFSPCPSPIVFHPVECSYCHSESMMGFRYRCQQCHNYQLCQDCFWRGHAGGSHSNQHQMKEYTSWVRQGPGNTYPRTCECRSEGQGTARRAGESRGKRSLYSSTPSFPSVPTPPHLAGTSSLLHLKPV